MTAKKLMRRSMSRMGIKVDYDPEIEFDKALRRINNSIDWHAAREMDLIDSRANQRLKDAGFRRCFEYLKKPFEWGTLTEILVHESDPKIWRMSTYF